MKSSIGFPHSNSSDSSTLSYSLQTPSFPSAKFLHSSKRHLSDPISRRKHNELVIYGFVTPEQRRQVTAKLNSENQRLEKRLGDAFFNSDDSSMMLF